MKIHFRRSFLKNLHGLKSSKIKREVEDLIETLEAKESITSVGNIKKLTGSKNAYRIRLGQYRVGFFLENGEITLAAILHRKDIYDKFP